MKGYGLLILLVAILLLLIPLPALPRQAATVAPPADIPDMPPVSTPPDTSEPDTQPPGAVFRILCGEQVTELPEREFLIRTLAFEMSPAYHTQALQAQAVAAYTYYGRRRQAQRDRPDEALKGADFATPDERFPADYTADALKQRWGDKYDSYYQKLCDAVDAVLGKTVTHNGQLIDACYFAISNGSTESAETVWGTDIPYLRPVASPGDKLAPDYQTVLTLTPAQVTAALTAESTVKLSEEVASWFGKPTLSDAGTVVSIPVGGTSLPGTRVRELLGLRSATFSVECKDGNFHFTVRGYGHGVGMSQYGADYLARQGYTWQEILQYYYQDVTIAE